LPPTPQHVSHRRAVAAHTTMPFLAVVTAPRRARARTVGHRADRAELQFGSCAVYPFSFFFLFI
jgi:hypothetical protein